MTPQDDSLDDPGEGLPASLARRRLALGVGLAILVLILAALVWFSVTNTETAEERDRLFGRLELPAEVVGD